MHRIVIGVMGAGEAARPDDLANAEELGERIAREGWVLLTGGRPEGVMGAANRGAAKVDGSLTLGILPSSSGGVAPEVDIAVFTGMGSARNNINVLSSDVVIACGTGGAGTVSEIALAIKAGTPVVVVQASDEARPFLEDLGGGTIHFAESVDETIELARQLVGMRPGSST